MNKMDLTNSGAAVYTGEIMGIDLGTTNSAVAIYDAAKVPKLLPIGEHGAFTVPSCVKWEAPQQGEGKTWTVGAEAYRERYMPDVIYSIKRLMGSGKTVRFIDRYNPDNHIDMTPAEVSGIILGYLKGKVAEFYKPITKCVITVPAYFNQLQINDTLEAAKLAGLECIQILKEPTSASYMYSQLGYATSGTVLIYDLGGGTFDVTHMYFLQRSAVPKKLMTSLQKQYGIRLEELNGMDANEHYFCRVLGTYGDVNLGGDDIDRYMADIVLKKSGIKLTPSQKEELCLRCEGFKKNSFASETVMVEGHLFNLSTEELDEAVDMVFDKTMKLMEGIDVSTVKTIVLVGGSTRSQRLRDNLSGAFPGVEISAVLDPDATVALGAGAVAKALAHDENLMYADVLPLPIGILVKESVVEVCIAKNTSMPYITTKTYYTMHDNQKTITLHIYQGMSTKPEENVYLGRLTLHDIPQAPAGEVCVQVGFMLTGEGRLKVNSIINGVQREEELVIDNIFDVNQTPGGMQEEVETYSVEGEVLQPLDDFERTFFPYLELVTGALDLVQMRRISKESGQKDLSELEDKLVSLLYI